MAQKTDIELNTQADIIANESTAGANTKGRIATMVKDVIDSKVNNSDIDNIDNTADADKPVSTAQAAAIATVQSDINTHEALTNNPHSVTKAQVGLSDVDNTSDAGKPVSTAQQTALDSKVDKETFTVLTDGATVTWNTSNKQTPQAKLTTTQSFTIDMTNVKDGSTGILKIITDTAAAVTLTFDTSFTNKNLNSTITTYTFPALTAQEYFLFYVVDGTTIEWYGDIANTKLSARLQRSATQTITTGGTGSAISWDVEHYDNGGIWAAGNPTRMTIPGSGNKRALITGYAQYSAVASAVNARRVIGYVNGSSVAITNGAFVDHVPLSNRAVDVPFSFQIDCVGGDYIELQAIQSQGSSLTVIAVAHITIENR